MRGTQIPPTFNFVRGAYYDTTPYHMWHRVGVITPVGNSMSQAITECGIIYQFPNQRVTFVDEDTCALTGGDRCTRGCNVPAAGL